MRGSVSLAALGMAALGWQAARAQDTTSKPGADLATAFGTREYIQQISLSPDGTKVAMIQPTNGRGLVLTIGDLANGGDPKAILSSTGDPERLAACHWSTDKRLICDIVTTVTVDGDRLGVSRIVAIDADGKNMKLLSARSSTRALGFAQDGGSLIDWGAGGEGAALMTRVYIPEESTGTHIAETRKGLGVELVDTSSLRRKPIEPPREGAIDYISDGHGNVRLMGIQPSTTSGYNSNKIFYSYRTADSRDWRAFDTVTVDGGQYVGFMPYAVDPTLNLAYGFDNQSGHTELYSVALDGSLTKKLVLCRPISMRSAGRAAWSAPVTSPIAAKPNSSTPSSRLCASHLPRRCQARSSPSSMPARMRASCYYSPAVTSIPAPITCSTKRRDRWPK